MSVPPRHAAPPATAAGRFAMLDGWRAASILLVLAGHLLPLGPRAWGLNAAVAAAGMALFFTLSGFLITRFLADGADLRLFLIRRVVRIVPLAWGVMLVLLMATGAPPIAWAANLLFFANLPPQHLVTGGGHLWSLCVEVQFYLGIALFVAVAGRRALIALPAVALAVTVLRWWADRPLDIVTWFRVDEILAGGILALAYAGWYGAQPMRVLGRIGPWPFLALLFAAAHPAFGLLDYLRPYLAAATVGATLAHAPRALRRLFETRTAAWIATISYALYIFHGALAETWLGSGDRLVKYAKRPLLLGVTFALAHLSTMRFEQPLIAWAKRATRGYGIRLPAPSESRG